MVVHEQPWYTIVWFVWGYTIVSSCFLRWFRFLTFPLHFPLLKFFYFLNEFLLFRILRNAQFPKIYDAFLKPNLKTSPKQFFKGVVHEQPWYTIVWFVWGYTIVSSCFLRWFCFLTFPLHFPLLKLFYFLNEFLLFRILRNAQFPKIYDALLKPN